MHGAHHIPLPRAFINSWDLDQAHVSYIWQSLHVQERWLTACAKLVALDEIMQLKVQSWCHD